MLATLAVLSTLAAASVSATEVVYNHIASQPTAMDALVHEHFGQFRRVVDVSDKNHTYVYPQGLGVRPASGGSVYFQHRCIEGSVVILYVIELDGSVVLPFVARSSHPALSTEALARVGKLHFRPALVDGEAVATVAATQYRFTCSGAGS